MNYLCAVLVLAFAAGSVHSTFCSNSGYYEPELKQEFVKQCNSHFPISLGSLPLLNAITLPLVGTLTKVTGVSLNLLDASVSIDNFHAHATIIINLACDSFPNTAIVIDINADLNTYLEDGCPLLGFSGLSVTLQISGTTLNLNKALIDEVLKSVTTTVTEVVNTILDKVLLTINCLSKSFTSVHIIGEQPCYYEISEAEIEGDLLKGTCCLHTEEGSECSENVAVALSDGILSAVKLTNNILSTILKSVIGSAKYLVKVPDSITGDLAINYGSPIYFRATYTGVDVCSFVPNGVEATLSVKVEIFAKTDLETPIISVTTKLYLTGVIYYKQGYWGIQLQASPSLDLDLEVEDDTCGCQDSILTWVKDYISCQLDGIIDTLNSKLQLCLQVPNPGGIPSTNTEVIPGQDYCEFRYL